MDNLQGKIISGIQQCEDQDIPYRAYVVQDNGADEIQIIDQDSLSDWFRSGQLSAYWIDRAEVVSVCGCPDVSLTHCLDVISSKIMY